MSPRTVEPVEEDDEDNTSPNSKMTKSEYRNSFGYRVGQRRKAKGLTQGDLAKIVNKERTSVSQWENNRARPHVGKLIELAAALGVRPEYLINGTNEGPAKDPGTDLAAIGLQIVPTISFGDEPDSRTVTEHWALPVTWLKSELHAVDPEKCFLTMATVAEAGYQPMDRLLIDPMSTRPSPAGTFLMWDGFGPAIAQMRGVQTKDGPRVSVTTQRDTVEVALAALNILGRVRGVWRHA